MVAVNGEWNQEQMETFLSDAVVPVRISCHHPDGGLWMLSLWYQFQDGTIRCATSESARIISFLRQNNEITFEISTNHPPYMGVRGSGTATLTPDEEKTVLEGLLQRYLGETDSPLATQLLSPDRTEVVITITPDRLYTWDFTPRMKQSGSNQSTEPESIRSPKFAGTSTDNP